MMGRSSLVFFRSKSTAARHRLGGDIVHCQANEVVQPLNGDEKCFQTSTLPSPSNYLTPNESNAVAAPHTQMRARWMPPQGEQKQRRYGIYVVYHYRAATTTCNDHPTDTEDLYHHHPILLYPLFSSDTLSRHATPWESSRPAASGRKNKRTITQHQHPPSQPYNLLPSSVPPPDNNYYPSVHSRLCGR